VPEVDSKLFVADRVFVPVYELSMLKSVMASSVVVAVGQGSTIVT
jgi:hypothetical protein